LLAPVEMDVKMSSLESPDNLRSDALATIQVLGQNTVL
jgi:hypothetical protein